MLSLNKTKSREELAAWLGDHDGLLSWKMDGLTIVLTYSGGELVKAVTRGNGITGEVITPNAKVFKNVPLRIAYKGDLVLRGEAVIRYSDFEKINASIPEADAKYKNPRNLCSGSVRQLDSSVTAKRSVYLYAFALISMSEPVVPDASDSTALTGGFRYRHEQLDYLAELGFDVVERSLVNSGNVADHVESFSKKIATNDFPSDGLVLIYDDIAYGQSLGRTAKFPRDGIAFKWADEEAETTLLEIEWSPSRTGLINPVAIFEPVELEGTTVSRASVHNVSIVEELALGIGDRIKVYKANMIIPQISENLTKSGTCAPPAACPVCGGATRVHDENGVRTLYCENPGCAAKKLGLFTHMAARDAMNIDGLSEATIEKLIDAGLIRTMPDFYKLHEHASEISNLEGFKEKSRDNLLAAIENSRHTTLARLIYSIGIANIGLANAKNIARYVQDDASRIPSLTADELTTIDGIGDVLAASFTEFFASEENRAMYEEMLKELDIAKDTAPASGGLSGKVFVITGSVEHFGNRNELKDYIEARGGKVTGSVTAKTSYLINNDITSSSSKNKTAKELGIPIITEDDFLKLAEEG